MTRNEKIAEVMGWGLNKHYACFAGKTYSLETFNIPRERYIKENTDSLNAAHLLIERMVADGLEVVMRIYGKNYGAMALEHVYHNDLDDIETHCHGSVNDAPDFPTAVVGLFCKVYSIDGLADHSGEMKHKED